MSFSSPVLICFKTLGTCKCTGTILDDVTVAEIGGLAADLCRQMCVWHCQQREKDDNSNNFDDWKLDCKLWIDLLSCNPVRRYRSEHTHLAAIITS